MAKKRGSKLGVKRGKYKKHLTEAINKDLENLVNENNEEINIENSVPDNSEIETPVKEIIEQHNEFVEKIVVEEITPEIKQSEIEAQKEITESEGDKIKRESRERNKQFEQTGEQAHEDWMNEYKNVSNDNERVNNDVETDKEKRPYQKRTKKEMDSEQALKDANAQFANGAMLLTFCDLIFPGIILWFFKNIKKDPRAKNIKHTDIVLTDDQAHSLEKVSDYAAKIIFDHVNPLVLFVINLGAMYYMNMKIKLDEQK